MTIGGKEYFIGQRIRIVEAKSVLHYSHEVPNDTIEHYRGIIGTIIRESNYDENARAELDVDPPHRDRFHRGMMRLYCDDVLELI